MPLQALGGRVPGDLQSSGGSTQRQAQLSPRREITHRMGARDSHRDRRICGSSIASLLARSLSMPRRRKSRLASLDRSPMWSSSTKRNSPRRSAGCAQCQPTSWRRRRLLWHDEDAERDLPGLCQQPLGASPGSAGCLPPRDGIQGSGNLRGTVPMSRCPKPDRAGMAPRVLRD